MVDSDLALYSIAFSWISRPVIQWKRIFRNSLAVRFSRMVVSTKFLQPNNYPNKRSRTFKIQYVYLIFSFLIWFWFLRYVPFNEARIMRIRNYFYYTFLCSNLIFYNITQFKNYLFVCLRFLNHTFLSYFCIMLKMSITNFY